MILSLDYFIGREMVLKRSEENRTEGACNIACRTSTMSGRLLDAPS